MHASQVVLLAEEHGLTLLQPETTRDGSFVTALRDLEPDVLLVASYGEILRKDVLELAPRGAFNVHASLLPRWRGAAPVHRAILAGDAETGVSVQRMVLALDEGHVLLERRTAIDAKETAGELSARLAELGGEAATAALDELEAGRATLTAQAPDDVTYAPKMTKAEGVLDWSRPAAELALLVRGTNPWPGARTSLPDGRELVVLEARVATGNPGNTGNIGASGTCAPPGPPGTLQAGSGTAKGAFLVATGEGVLELSRVKPAGKAAMAGDEFLRGARLGPGEVLGT